MQQTVPKEGQDPLDRPPKFEQTLAKEQMPASAFGETHVVPSIQFKLDANVDRGEFDTKLVNGLFLNRGNRRLSVSESILMHNSISN